MLVAIIVFSAMLFVNDAIHPKDVTDIILFSACPTLLLNTTYLPIYALAFFLQLFTLRVVVYL